MTNFLICLTAVLSGYIIGDIVGWVRVFIKRDADLKRNAEDQAQYKYTENYSHLRNKVHRYNHKGLTPEEIEIRYSSPPKKVYEAKIVGNEIKIEN